MTFFNFKSIPTRQIPELDTLRFVAVSLVLGHHVFFVSDPFFRWLEQHGYVGVDLFFTLSGFIITRGLQREFSQAGSLNLKGFWVRRMLRLWPSLFVALVFSSALIFMFGRSNPELGNLFASTWWHYFLQFGNYSYIHFGRIHDVFGHYWSLAVEEHFYLIWPLAFLLILSKRSWAFLLLPIFCIVPYLFRLNNIEAGLPEVVNTFSTHTRFDALAYGCILAMVWSKIPPIKWRSLEIALWILTITMLQWALDLKYLDTAPVIKAGFRTVISIAAVLIIILMVKGPDRGLRRIWAHPLTAKLGVLSYGVYLFHPMTNAVLFKVLTSTAWPVPHYVIFLVSNLMAYIAAYLSYVLIDLNFYKLRRKLGY